MVYDITGKRSFLELFRDAYLKGVAGVLAVFDMTRRSTLGDLARGSTAPCGKRGGSPSSPWGTSRTSTTGSRSGTKISTPSSVRGTSAPSGRPPRPGPTSRMRSSGSQAICCSPPASDSVLPFAPRVYSAVTETPPIFQRSRFDSIRHRSRQSTKTRVSPPFGGGAQTGTGLWIVDCGVGHNKGLNPMGPVPCPTHPLSRCEPAGLLSRRG